MMYLYTDQNENNFFAVSDQPYTSSIDITTIIVTIYGLVLGIVFLNLIYGYNKRDTWKEVTVYIEDDPLDNYTCDEISHTDVFVYKLIYINFIKKHNNQLEFRYVSPNHLPHMAESIKRLDGMVKKQTAEADHWYELAEDPFPEEFGKTSLLVESTTVWDKQIRAENRDLIDHMSRLRKFESVYMKFNITYKRKPSYKYEIL